MKTKTRKQQTLPFFFVLLAFFFFLFPSSSFNFFYFGLCLFLFFDPRMIFVTLLRGCNFIFSSYTRLRTFRTRKHNNNKQIQIKRHIITLLTYKLPCNNCYMSIIFHRHHLIAKEQERNKRRTVGTYIRVVTNTNHSTLRNNEMEVYYYYYY